MGVFKLYTKEVRGQEGFVYFYLYKLNTGDKQPSLSSLKIKLPKQYCLFSSKDGGGDFKRVSKELPLEFLRKTGFETVEILNSYLQEQLQIFISSNGKRVFTPMDEKTINDYFEIQINRQLNQGTKLRYKNLFNLLIQFQKWYSVNIQKREENSKIYFTNFTVDYIFELKKWLLREPEKGEFRGRNSLNSCNYKLKGIKSIINKSHSEGYYSFIINPFDQVKFSFKNEKLEVLTLDELKKIISTNFVEVLRRTGMGEEGEKLWGKEIKDGVEERNRKNRRYVCKHTLNDIRNYFIFQLTCQGIRVSDLVTLRWIHFKKEDLDIRIQKTMVKTGKEVSILVNEKMTSILSKYIVRYEKDFPELTSEIRIVNQEIIELDRYSQEGFIFQSNEVHSSLVLKVFPNESERIVSSIGQVNYKFKREDLNLIRNYLKECEENGSLLEVLEIEIPKKIKVNKEFLSMIRKQTMNEIRGWFLQEIEKINETIFSQMDGLREHRHNLVSTLVVNLSLHDKLKEDFVFDFLKNKDFEDIVNDDFSRLSEYQYRKFQSVRTYYNKLLKIIGTQSGVNKKITSHLSRHSYTSLMLDLGENVNLYDLMTSLGHKHLSTTQTYIQKLSNKKMDKLNLVISDNLNTGLTMRL
jgi:integrase